MCRLELTHVDAYHRRLLAEESLGKCAGELGLSDARWPEEQEAAYRTIRIGESCASPPHRLGDRLYCFFLTDNALVEPLFEMYEPLAFFLG